MLLFNRLPQILMVMLMMSTHTDGHTVCSAVSTVQDTTVTCLFGTDISQRGFSVLVFATPRSESRMLLACNRHSSGGLICDIRKDVDFDKSQKVIDQLTLTRPPSNHTQGVQYLCEAVPSVEDHVQRCNLTYKDINVPSPSEKERNKQQHFHTDYLGWILTGIIMMIVIIILIIVVACIIILWTRKEKMREWWAEPNKHLLTTAFEDPENVPADAIGDTNCPDSLAAKQKKPLGRASTRIPSGVPSYFYNLGWKEAMKDNEQEHGKIPDQPQRQTPSSSSGSAPHGHRGDKPKSSIQPFQYTPPKNPGTVKEKQTSQAVSNPATNGQGKEMKRHGSYDIVADPSEEKGAYAEGNDGDETRRLTGAGDEQGEETDRGKAVNGEQKKSRFSNLFKRSQKDKPKKENPQKTKEEPKGTNRQVQEKETESLV